jgi:diguanylate cyclase (GGDEF)-like protein
MQVAVTPQSQDVSTPKRRGVLVFLTGPRPAGEMIEIPDGGDFVVGRTTEASHAIDDDSLSRRHARFFQLAGKYAIEDLKSTNGTFVEGKRLTEPVFLEPGQRIQLGKDVVVRFELQDAALIEEQKRLREAMTRDKLTGVYNRHYLDEQLGKEFGFAQRHGLPLSLLFIDADHFKKVNDTFGHAGGDAVLVALGKLLLGVSRGEDVPARYGGEEFILVLRGTNAMGVATLAERIRAEVQALKVEHEGKPIPFTVSIGTATHAPEKEYPDTAAMLAAADGALYKAKATGRNRVIAA